MNIRRKEINQRADWAGQKYMKILKSILPSEYISAKKHRKLNQAYRVYVHYRDEFNRTNSNNK